MKEVTSVKYGQFFQRPSLPKFAKIMAKKKTYSKNVTYEALIDLKVNKDGLHKIDILPCEDVLIERFLGGFNAKGQQDGSIFLKEKPKRKRLRNTPDFRTPRLYMSLDCQDGYDYVGFQAGNSLDKWQMVAIDSLKWRQNDSGGTNSTNWTAWKTILDSNNSGIVDGHKVKLDGTSIEVPVAYSIPSHGTFLDGYWHKLGEYVTAGDATSFVLTIYDGKGYNSQAEQNSIARIMIKDGWQSSRSATNSVGVTIERFGNYFALECRIVATAHNAGAVWIYFPWQYASGTYEVSGQYTSWTHNSSTTSDTTTAPTTNQTKDTTNDHSYLYFDNAYTNSNVASATKLQTARSIWGNLKRISDRSVCLLSYLRFFRRSFTDA